MKKLAKDRNSKECEMMKIKVDRSSVCAGDDVLSHFVEYDVQEDLTVREFIDLLNQKHYIPRIQGNDVAWELRNSGGEIAVYFTKKNVVINGDNLLKTIIEETGSSSFVFLYHWSPIQYLKRKKIS